MTTLLIVLTNAPDVYDYGYVVPLGMVPSWLLGKRYDVTQDAIHPTRIVGIPNDHADYQIGRYFSGSYFADRVGSMEVTS